VQNESCSQAQDCEQLWLSRGTHDPHPHDCQIYLVVCRSLLRTAGSKTCSKSHSPNVGAVHVNWPGSPSISVSHGIRSVVTFISCFRLVVVCQLGLGLKAPAKKSDTIITYTSDISYWIPFHPACRRFAPFPKFTVFPCVEHFPIWAAAHPFPRATTTIHQTALGLVVACPCTTVLTSNLKKEISVVCDKTSSP